MIVNRLTGHCIGDVFDELSLPISGLEHTFDPVFEGGPVNPELGLIIHDEGGENRWESSLEIGGGLWLTSSLDILSALAGGRGPANAMMILGYAGWGAGANWNLNSGKIPGSTRHPTIRSSSTPVSTRNGIKPRKLLGIDYARLSTEVGHA